MPTAATRTFAIALGRVALEFKQSTSEGIAALPQHVYPKWKRDLEMVRVRIWPLSSALCLEGGWNILEKFVHALDTRDRGRS